MKNTIMTMSNIHDGEVNANELMTVLNDLDSVVGRFELNEDGSVESLDSYDYWEEKEGFIEYCLPLVNKYSVVQSDDGYFSVVNGQPLSFIPTVGESVQGIQKFKDECFQYTGSEININLLIAPNDFKASQYFSSGDIDELQKILFFDGRTLPNYMDDISRIETSDMVGSPEGYINNNNNQSSFEFFGESWDLDIEVYRLEYDEDADQLFDAKFTARDFVENKVDLKFYNLNKIESPYVKSLNDNIKKEHEEEQSYSLGR